MKKQILSIVLSIIMLATMLTMDGITARASSVPLPTEINGAFDLSAGNVVINAGGIYVINQTDSNSTSNTVTINSSCTVYLNGVDILVPNPDSTNDFSKPNPININGAYMLNIYLVDGTTNTLASEDGDLVVIGNWARYGSGKAALRVPAEASLNIYGDTGVLNATGAQGQNYSTMYAHAGGGAGIGGDGGFSDGIIVKNGESSGTVNIYGGVITATGGHSMGFHGHGGTGIGSGGERHFQPIAASASSGAITISGGRVTATGGGVTPTGGGSTQKSGYGVGGAPTIIGGTFTAKSATEEDPIHTAIVHPAIENAPILPKDYKWKVSGTDDYTVASPIKYSHSDAQTYVEIFIEDIIKPGLIGGVVNRTSDTQASVKFTSDEAGGYYYQVVEDGAEVPTLDTTGAGTACTTAETTINLTGITEGAKDIYIKVKDAANNVSDILQIEIPDYVEQDTTAPVLSNGAVNRTSATQATVTFTSDEAGGYFFEVLKDGEASVLSTGGTGTPCLIGVTSFNLVALGADSKIINIKVKDAANNVSEPLTINIPAYVDTTPMVTGVSVSPGTVSVAKGATQQFEVAVAGTNSPGQTVLWHLVGDHNENTGISETGLLTVSSDEEEATLTIRATSTVDSDKNGVATVTIAESVPDPAPNPAPAPSPTAESDQKTEAEKEAERIAKVKQEWEVSDSNPKNYLTTVKSDDGKIVSSGVPTKNQSTDYFNLIVKNETQEAERVFAKTSAENQIVVTFSKASYGEELKKLFETTAALQNGKVSKVIQVTAQERTKKDYKLIRDINTTEEAIRYSAQLSDELLAEAKAGKKILVIGYNHVGEIEVISDLDETLGIVTFETKNPTGIFAFVIV